LEEGSSGTHIYAIRFPIDQPLKREMLPPAQEQHPGRQQAHSPMVATQQQQSQQQQQQQQQQMSSGSKVVVTTNHRIVKPKKVDGKSMAAREISVDQLFTREAMMEVPKFRGA
jgi:hypothetical protein